jgi:RHS repeat-associated protein
VAAILGLLAVLAVGGAGKSQEPTALLQGQSVTLLPNGQWLFVGGEGQGGPLTTVSAGDSPSSPGPPLPVGLDYARAWHAAMVLSDGTVAVIGGIDAKGYLVIPCERFDPSAASIISFNLPKQALRSHHTATLLPDGDVLIVGGLSGRGDTLGSVVLWSPRDNSLTTLPASLNVPRSGHTATLTSQGTVLIAGGVDQDGQAVKASELYDPVLGISRVVDPSNSPSSNNAAAQVVSSVPANGAKNVPLHTPVSVLFSQPIDVTTANTDTLNLSSPAGPVSIEVVTAEGGKLAFLNPATQLAPDTTYTVTVNGVVARGGSSITDMAFSFTTGSSSAISDGTRSLGSASAVGSLSGRPSVWIPTADWMTHLPPSPWQSLPPLRAPRGVTALAGQVLTINGSPLAGVTLKIARRSAITDGSGRFLLLQPPVGHGVLLINGATANQPGISFGIFQAGVSIQARTTKVLNYTIWMPVLDTAHAASVASPTTAETVVSNPLVPALSLDIPAGTVITDINGRVTTTLTITPVPLDRPPFPLPAGVQVPIYFTIQPGGGQLWGTKGGWAWAQLYYPNTSHLAQGALFDFWNYEADGAGWYVYGAGHVNADRSEIVPDPGVGIYEFSGAMVGNPPAPPKTGPSSDDSSPSDDAGEPVDTSTGILRHSETDLVLPDTLPIKLTRTYVSQDNYSRPFGIGWSDRYELFLQGSAHPWTYINLILPDGEQVYFTNIGNVNSFTQAVYTPTLSPGAAYYGSSITWNGIGWNLRLKDGTTYVFPDSEDLNIPALAAVTSIFDRYGNKLTITRDGSGNVTQITSPDGRWVQFQHDSGNRITQTIDNIGRTITYRYDLDTGTTCNQPAAAVGLLCQVTDANGGITKYTYDAGNRLLTIVDRRGNTALTNTYDPTSGRVTNQVLADGTSTFTFAYTIDGSHVTQTSITDPNSAIEQKNFDNNGFVVSDTYALGQSVQQTLSFTRDPGTELVTSVTDPLSRQTTYAYDGNGDLTSVTRLAATAQAVTASLIYDPIFNQLTSVTDPLGHVWNITRDSSGNATAITDPLGDATSLTYNLKGQPLSITDALGDAAQLGYNVYGDLSSITDPLGNTSLGFVDAAGRLDSVTDPLGATTILRYDPLNRLTQITDPLNGVTAFTYDGNSNLLSVTDAKKNNTSYTYDTRNRLTKRTDALSKADSYVYDSNSDLTQYTDRRGKIDTFTYDALDRRTAAHFGQNGTKYQDTISYTWDGGNRLTKAADSTAGSITRQFDELDRLTQETTSQGTVGYHYDAANRRSTMTVSGQSQISYTWDNANRLTGITQGANAVGLSYDNADRRTCLTLPNSVIVGFGYDFASNLTGLTYGTTGSCASPGSNLGNLTYTYDKDGRRTGFGGTLGAVNLPTPVTTAKYNADNALTNFGGAALKYDGNGNLTSDGTNTYTWDARNHLSAISGGATAGFVYDALGRRMKQTIGSTVTQLLYDGLNTVQLLNGAVPTAVIANLLTGPGIDEYFWTSANGGMAYLVDGLSSTIGLVNSSGSTAASYTYQPYGQATATGSASNAFQFTGRENDGTGLYFYRARYYNPTYQRFIAQDPIGFAGGSTNLYTYVMNSPVGSIDPLGLTDCTSGGNGLSSSNNNALGPQAVSSRNDNDLREQEGNLWNTLGDATSDIPTILPPGSAPAINPGTPENSAIDFSACSIGDIACQQAASDRYNNQYRSYSRMQDYRLGQ